MKKTLTTVALLSLSTSLSFAEESNELIEEILVLGQEFSSVSKSGSRLGLSLK